MSLANSKRRAGTKKKSDETSHKSLNKDLHSLRQDLEKENGLFKVTQL